MGKIVITTNMSLDGVVQDPDGKEGTSRGGWFGRSGGEDLQPWAELALAEALAAEALLLGRRSDQWFAARWPSRDGRLADRLNGMPKYVVSATLDRPEWSNATVLTGVDQVAELKRRLTGDILVYASYQLGQALLEHDLVDELRVAVFPVVAGAGTRLFGPTTAGKPMRLLGTSTIGSDLVHLTYRAG
jgi:dihydrofolate reductase